MYMFNHTMVESENLLLILDGYKTLYLHKYINTARLNSVVVLTFKFVTNVFFVYIYIECTEVNYI